MARATATGIKGLYVEHIAHSDGTVEERYRIDLRWRDPVTGKRQRHAERLPAKTNAATAKKRALLILSGTTAGTFDPAKDDADARRLHDALDEYLAWARTNRPLSLSMRETQCKVIKAAIGDKALTALCALDLERLKRDRIDGKVAVPSTLRKGAGRIERTVTNKVGAASVNRCLAVAKHAIGLFVTWGWLPESRAAELRKVKPMKESAGRVRELSAEEEEKILGLLPLRARQIVESALLTGCRRAEIVTLRRDAVNLRTREITLLKTKNGRVRVVPISDRLETIISEAMRAEGSEFVFPLDDGQPYSVDSISRAFARACKSAGIVGASFHTTRHSFATRLRRQGVQLDTLQKMGGWSSLVMVQRYAHLDHGELHAAAALLGGSKVCHTTSTQEKAPTEKPNHLHEVK